MAYIRSACKSTLLFVSSKRSAIWSVSRLRVKLVAAMMCSRVGFAGITNAIARCTSPILDAQSIGISLAITAIEMWSTPSNMTWGRAMPGVTAVEDRSSRLIKARMSSSG